MSFKGVSGEELVPEGKAFRGYRKGQHPPGLLYLVVLAVPRNPQFVRGKAFKIEGGHVEEHKRGLFFKSSYFVGNRRSREIGWAIIHNNPLTQALTED